MNKKQREEVAGVIMSLSSKEEYLRLLLNKESEYLSQVEVGILVSLYKPTELMDSELFVKILEHKYLLLKSVVLLKKEGLCMRWLGQEFLAAKNYRGLCEALLFLPFVKSGKYLEELYDASVNMTPYVNNSDKDVQKYLVEIFEGEILYFIKDIFYVFQKDFLLDKGSYSAFLKNGDFEPLIARGLIKEIIYKTPLEKLFEACEALYKFDNSIAIYNSIKQSCSYLFGNEYFCGKKYTNQELGKMYKLAYMSDGVGLKGVKILMPSRFDKLLSYVESKGVKLIDELC